MKILLPASRTRMILTVLAVLVIIYFALDPAKYTTLFPKCPFNYLTGYKCPGCGSQRAVHELLNFHFKDAFLANPLLVLAIPYILGAFLFDYTDLNLKYPGTRKFLYGNKSLLVVILIVLVYWILRNL